MDASDGRVIGSSRYYGYSEDKSEVEIGWTFLARSHWGGRYNREMKELMLRHAFEQLNCIRVELKTDILNERSRNAILRIGAKQEGIFRNHMITSSGRIRSSVYYSIIDSEWPDVKAGLEEKLSRQ